MSSSSIWQRKLDPSKGEIRLLQLEPNTDINSLPKGRLLIGSIRRFSDFDAISHAWGAPQPSVLISLGGPDTYWPVTENLCTAFRYLRDPVKHRRFWVDALCINPFDIEERGQQIAFLQDIFNNADTVHVWIRSVSEAVLDATKWLKLIGGTDVSEIYRRKKTKDHIEKIVPFFEDEWWHRLWVKQEVALARKILFHCNDLIITLNDLSKFAGALSSILRFSHQNLTSTEFQKMSECLTRLQHIQQLRNLKPAELPERRLRIISLVRMLQVTRKARVTDPRDRVYALLSICARLFDEHMNDVALMQANYNHDIVEVFTMFAYKLIEVSGSLYIFNQVSPLHNSVRALPSWVPDWTSYFDHDLRMLTESRERFHPDHVSSQTRIPANPLLHSPSHTLGLQGHIIGYITSVGNNLHSPGRDIGPDFRTSLSSTIKCWAQHYVSEDSEGQFSTPERYELGPFSSVIAGSCRDVRSLKSESKEEDEKVHSIIEDPLAAKIDDVHQIYHVVRNSGFFICKLQEQKPSPGLGPLDTRTGDNIAILNGGDTAYVLRSIPDEKNQYLFSFVGECFVYGAMRGNKVPQREPVTIWLK